MHKTTNSTVSVLPRAQQTRAANSGKNLHNCIWALLLDPPSLMGSLGSPWYSLSECGLSQLLLLGKSSQADFCI